MNPEIFAEWLRLQGYIIYRSPSSYWFNQGPRVLQAFPYHWLIRPSEEELSDLMKSKKALGLRYSTPLDAAQGTISYHAVYEQADYDLENLGKWARKNVRRGLNHCRVEPISFQRLADEGFALQLDTLDRQGRRLGLKKGAWARRCLSAARLPGFEAWGALVEGKLAASVMTFPMNDCMYMLYQQCHRDYLADHVNNALSFVVTQTLIRRPQVKSIFYGLHSLDAPPSVDEFKFRMGYAANPVRQRVIFHPALGPFLNSASHALLRSLLRLRPGDPTLAKTEGLLRFHLYGKLPLSHQPVPPPLKKDALNSSCCPPTAGNESAS